MRKLVFVFLFLCGFSIMAQTGVNTPLPLGMFHVDAKKDNLSNTKPNADQIKNDVLVDAEGRLGIGTITPEAKLDVMGDVRIEEILSVSTLNVLNPSDVSPLFINSEGSLGVANISKEAKLTFTQSIENLNNTLVFYNQFNLGNAVNVPFKQSDIKINVDNIVGVAGSDLKIRSEGFYQISSSVNAKIAGSSAGKVYFKGTLVYSEDNGSTWNVIVGIRPIITVTTTLTSYPLNFPSTIVKLKKDALIRMFYTRSSTTGGVQGISVNSVFLGEELLSGLNTLQLSIWKL